MVIICRLSQSYLLVNYWYQKLNFLIFFKNNFVFILQIQGNIKTQTLVAYFTLPLTIAWPFLPNFMQKLTPTHTYFLLLTDILLLHTLKSFPYFTLHTLTLFIEILLNINSMLAKLHYRPTHLKKV